MHYTYVYYFDSIKDPSIKVLIEEIVKRISFVRLIELQTPKGTKGKKVNEVKEIEKNILISKVFEKHKCVVICTERGQEYSTQEFYKKLTAIDTELAVVISGPYGPHEEILNMTYLKLALSKMTFTHEMALYLLLEQLYRVHCFEQNIEYTK